jgi:hypothetical protein
MNVCAASRAADIGDPIAMTDAEELAAKLLAAVGLRSAIVHRTAPTEVYMEHVHGRLGVEVVGWGPAVPLAILASDDGRLLGLADAYVLNFDRNDEVTHDGRVLGVDHGSAKFEDASAVPSSPFAHFLYELGADGGARIAPTNDFSPTDMAAIGQRSMRCATTSHASKPALPAPDRAACCPAENFAWSRPMSSLERDARSVMARWRRVCFAEGWSNGYVYLAPAAGDRDASP